jgi:hypothetical protein
MDDLDHRSLVRLSAEPRVCADEYVKRWLRFHVFPPPPTHYHARAATSAACLWSGPGLPVEQDELPAGSTQHLGSCKAMVCRERLRKLLS